MTAKETAGRAGNGEDGRARTREVKLAVFFTVLDDGAPWICYPDIGIADLIPVPRLSR